MIKLKQVIHYADTNSVEATWVDRTSMPDVEVPEVIQPDTEGPEGEVIPGEIIPAHTVKGEVIDVQVKCRSYADVQMDMFRTDVAELGGDIQKYEGVIAQVEAGIKPPPPKTPEQINAEIKAQIATLEAAQPRAIREAILTGDNTRLAALDADIAALRTQLLVVGA